MPDRDERRKRRRKRKARRRRPRRGRGLAARIIEKPLTYAGRSLDWLAGTGRVTRAFFAWLGDERDSGSALGKEVLNLLAGVPTLGQWKPADLSKAERMVSDWGFWGDVLVDPLIFLAFPKALSLTKLAVAFPAQGRGMIRATLNKSTQQAIARAAKAQPGLAAQFPEEVAAAVRAKRTFTDQDAFIELLRRGINKDAEALRRFEQLTGRKASQAMRPSGVVAKVPFIGEGWTIAAPGVDIPAAAVGGLARGVQRIPGVGEPAGRAGRFLRRAFYPYKGAVNEIAEEARLVGQQRRVETFESLTQITRGLNEDMFKAVGRAAHEITDAQIPLPGTPGGVAFRSTEQGLRVLEQYPQQAEQIGRLMDSVDEVIGHIGRDMQEMGGVVRVGLRVPLQLTDEGIQQIARMPDEIRKAATGRSIVTTKTKFDRVRRHNYRDIVVALGDEAVETNIVNLIVRRVNAHIPAWTNHRLMREVELQGAPIAAAKGLLQKPTLAREKAFGRLETQLAREQKRLTKRSAALEQARETFGARAEAKGLRVFEASRKRGVTLRDAERRHAAALSLVQDVRDQIQREGRRATRQETRLLRTIEKQSARHLAASGREQTRAAARALTSTERALEQLESTYARSSGKLQKKLRRGVLGVGERQEKLTKAYSGALKGRMQIQESVQKLLRPGVTVGRAEAALRGQAKKVAKLGGAFQKEEAALNALRQEGDVWGYLSQADPEFAEWVRRGGFQLPTPGPLEKQLLGIKGVISPALTLMNPGFHFRNWLSGIFLGGWHPDISSKQFRQFDIPFWKNLFAGKLDAKTFDNALGETLTGKELREWLTVTVGQRGIVRELEGMDIIYKRAPKWTGISQWYNAGEAVGTGMEKYMRATAAFSLWKGGRSLTNAASEANDWLVNYLMPSRYSRGLRALIPFAQFQVGATPKVLAGVARRPVKGLLLEAVLKEGDRRREEQGGRLPPWMEARRPIPIGDRLVDISGILPATSITLGAAEPGRFIEQGLLSALTPAIRAPAELGLGRQFFTGRRAEPAEIALGALPTARIYGTGRGLLRAYEKEQLPEAAFRTLTGIGLYEAEGAQQQRQKDVRDLTAIQSAEGDYNLLGRTLTGRDISPEETETVRSFTEQYLNVRPNETENISRGNYNQEYIRDIKPLLGIR